jgi:hypothetical protein
MILRAPWPLPLTAIMVVCSVILCFVDWPDSQIGVFVNLVLAVVLLLPRRLGGCYDNGFAQGSAAPAS